MLERSGGTILAPVADSRPGRQVMPARVRITSLACMRAKCPNKSRARFRSPTSRLRDARVSRSVGRMVDQRPTEAWLSLTSILNSSRSLPWMNLKWGRMALPRLARDIRSSGATLRGRYWRRWLWRPKSLSVWERGWQGTVRWRLNIVRGRGPSDRRDAAERIYSWKETCGAQHGFCRTMGIVEAAINVARLREGDTDYGWPLCHA